MTNWITHFQGRLIPPIGEKVQVTYWNGHKEEGYVFLDMDDKPGLMTDYAEPDFDFYQPVCFPWSIVKDWKVIREIDENG